ncbi:MAG: mechanosensitive ion channel family protein [Thaumarchaeota archaeon]|nr:mechanosensitive ion channel family protein [Nitrososphaerota archaeon]
MWSSARRPLTLVALILGITAVVGYAQFVVSSSVYASQAYGNAFKYIYALIILGGGIFVSREFAGFIGKTLKPKLGNNSLVASNAVVVGGYIMSAAAAAFYVSFSPTTLLAGAAFSGLVLGLALQPTLGSFFAGILMLVSGTIRPGSQVRILSWHIPFQWAFTPGYKYFSPDAIYSGYMAQVMNIGLFFTTVLTEEGQTMKIPNTILATDAAIVAYTGRDYIFNVRYEFSNRFDPRLVLERVKEETRDFPVLSAYVNEQSDKEYYIVKVVLNAKERDHAALKSEILMRFVNLQNELRMQREDQQLQKQGQQG